VSLSEPAIRRPIATVLLMAGLAFLGLTAFPRLPVAPLPQIDFPTILVTAALSGASAETMSSSVAAPLERQFAQIAGVTEMTSFSALGATSVTIQFDLGRDIDAAAQDVQAAIAAASKTLPQSMALPPIYKKLNPADAPILMLSVRSDTLPMIAVRICRQFSRNRWPKSRVLPMSLGENNGPQSASRWTRRSSLRTG
jgi:HAE1 family hydrophobic/amphiphilic exporter-1